MRYASILFVVIFCLSCMGVAVSGTDVGPAKIDDGRYIASHKNKYNYTWTLEINFQNRQIISTKITVKNKFEESVGAIGDLEFYSYSRQLSGWLEMWDTNNLYIRSRKITGKFPKIEMWDGGDWGGAKWHLLRSGE